MPGSKAEEIHESIISWSWDSKWNEETCGYVISQDGHQISTIPNSRKEKGEICNNMPILISSRSFGENSGIFSFEITWIMKTPYCAVGLVTEDEIRSPDKMKNFESSHPNISTFNYTWARGYFHNQKTEYYCLDMNLLKFYNGNEFKDISKLRNKNIYIGIAMRNEGFPTVAIMKTSFV